MFGYQIGKTRCHQTRSHVEHFIFSTHFVSSSSCFSFHNSHHLDFLPLTRTLPCGRLLVPPSFTLTSNQASACRFWNRISLPISDCRNRINATGSKTSRLFRHEALFSGRLEVVARLPMMLVLLRSRSSDFFYQLLSSTRIDKRQVSGTESRS
jgi:hypothetical protein